MTRKTRQDGIRTLDDLKARCDVAPDTGCWMWRGAMHHGSARVWLPDIGPAAMNLALPFLATGQRPPSGAIYLPTCGHVSCGNWAHRRLGSRSELMAMLRPALPAEHRRRVAAGKRKACGKYSFAAHVDMMTSTEPTHVLAARWNVGLPLVCRVRRGEAWSDVPWRTVRETPPGQFTVRELPAGYVSVLNAAECRPWIAAAVQPRAAE